MPIFGTLKKGESMITERKVTSFVVCLFGVAPIALMGGLGCSAAGPTESDEEIVGASEQAVSAGYEYSVYVLDPSLGFELPGNCDPTKYYPNVIAGKISERVDPNGNVVMNPAIPAGAAKLNAYVPGSNLSEGWEHLATTSYVYATCSSVDGVGTDGATECAYEHVLANASPPPVAAGFSTKFVDKSGVQQTNYARLAAPKNPTDPTAFLFAFRFPAGRLIKYTGGLEPPLERQEPISAKKYYCDSTYTARLQVVDPLFSPSWALGELYVYDPVTCPGCRFNQ